MGDHLDETEAAMAAAGSAMTCLANRRHPRARCWKRDDVSMESLTSRFPHKSAAFSAYGAAISHTNGDTRARGQTIVSTTRVRFAAVYVDSTRAHATRMLAAHAREIRSGHEWHRYVWRAGDIHVHAAGSAISIRDSE